MRRAPFRNGFTLVELMVVVLVVGILAAIAIPTYNESVRKSRRADAMTALAAVQQAQERWRGSQPAYTTSLSDLNMSSSSPSGYYALSLAAPDAGGDGLDSGYIVTATANTGTSQAADSACVKMSVRMRRGNLAYAGGSGDLSYTETHACFAR